VKELEESHNLKFLKSTISDRVAFKYSIAQGKAVFEMNGQDRDSKAVEEMTAFHNELMEEIQK